MPKAAKSYVDETRRGDVCVRGPSATFDCSGRCRVTNSFAAFRWHIRAAMKVLGVISSVALIWGVASSDSSAADAMPNLEISLVHHTSVNIMLKR